MSTECIYTVKVLYLKHSRACVPLFNFMAAVKVMAIQSVAPGKVTEPRVRRRISMSGELQPDFVQKHMQVILYYKKSEEEECGLKIGGWLKDSLSCALSEQPLMAGRLYKSSDGEWELVSNDSGVRLVEAQLDMSLPQFLDWDKRRDVEHQLGYWKDIEEQNPHFSALFYVQVSKYYATLFCNDLVLYD